MQIETDIVFLSFVLICFHCIFGKNVAAQGNVGPNNASQGPFVLGPGTQLNRTPPNQLQNNGANTNPITQTQPTLQNSNTLGGLPASGGNANGQNGKQEFPRVAANPNAKMLASKPAVGEEFKPGTVVANVGGYPIFRGDVIADINQLIEANMAGAPESIKNQQRELALPFAVDRAIEQKLLFVDAIRSLPDPAKLPELKQSIREQFTELRLPELLTNLKAKSPAEAEAKLRKLGTSLRQARDSWVDGQLAGYFVRDKINVNPEVTHFEMLEYYNENREDYHFDPQVRWEQIVIRYDKSDSKQAAWDRLGQIGNEVVYGANFSAVARKSSHGLEADKGGYHDWTTKGSLNHEKVDEALFSLPVNQLSDRIESKIGFHIIRVIERKTEGYVPFSKCQSEIKKKIKQEKQNAALKEYVGKLKKRFRSRSTSRAQSYLVRREPDDRSGPGYWRRKYQSR